MSKETHKKEEKVQYKVLSHEEEIELFYQAKEGNQEALDSIVFSYMGYVRQIASTFIDEYNSLEDLVQDGVIGLITAINKYDPSHNTRIGTFAYMYIKREIATEARKRRTVVRIPHMTEFKVRKKLTECIRATGCITQDDIQRISEETNCELETIRSVYNAIQDNVSFCDNVTNSDSLVPTATVTADPDIESDVIDDMVRAADITTIKQLMKYLPIKHRMILALKYGLTDGTPRSYEDIGIEFNCNRQRVHEIVSESQKKILLLYKANINNTQR